MAGIYILSTSFRSWSSKERRLPVFGDTGDPRHPTFPNASSRLTSRSSHAWATPCALFPASAASPCLSPCKTKELGSYEEEEGNSCRTKEELGSYEEEEEEEEEEELAVVAVVAVVVAVVAVVVDVVGVTVGTGSAERVDERRETAEARRERWASSCIRCTWNVTSPQAHRSSDATTLAASSEWRSSARESSVAAVTDTMTSPGSSRPLATPPPSSTEATVGWRHSGREVSSTPSLLSADGLCTCSRGGEGTPCKHQADGNR